MANPFSKKPAARPSPPPVITPPESPVAKAHAAEPAKVVAVDSGVKDALRELLTATPHDLARVFDTPDAYSRYLKARAEALKHV